jgi:MYXO-CTERM domain-containing protein
MTASNSAFGVGRRSHRVLALVSFVGIALGATSAAADVISDEEAECDGKTDGDSCSLDGKAGSCAKSSCGKNDYSDGVPPKHVQVDCLVCVPAKDDPSETPAKTDPKATTVEPTKTAGDAKSSEVPTTRGCANARVADPSTAAGCGVLGLVLLGLARRRRRTSRGS